MADSIGDRTRQAWNTAKQPTGQPRPTRPGERANDAQYSDRFEDTWGKGHPVPAGYRGQPVAAPGPDTDPAPTPARPEWERLFQESQPWPEDADPQASPGRPVPPWQQATERGREA